MVTAEKAKELLDYNAATGVISWRSSKGRSRKGDIAGTLDSKGYLQIGIDGRLYRAHRIAWLIACDAWPEDQIDHINGIRTDNRLENLRCVTCQGNRRNAAIRSNNTSGIAGVHWNKSTGAWQARIAIDGKYRHIGFFDDIKDAALARKESEKKHGFHENHGRSQ